MNFTVFPTGTTNIWPLANDTKANGQLMTEYNLRSRESVGTDEIVEYMIGPSYCHNEDSFKVQCLSDGAGTTISTSTLEILPGRALVNGHFIESLSNVTIDMVAANEQLKKEGKETLSGKICIGLRAMYSTEPTMAGAMVADKNEFYEGIQVVILPKDEFKLPTDCPYDQDQVTAHLLLGTCNFVNQTLNTLVDNYPDKCEWIEASRIANVEGLLSDIYITKTNLNPKKLYTFAGKGTDPKTGYDTWCDSLDSLMVWDNNPKLTLDKPSVKEATFGTNTNGKTQLIMPHKQVDGMTNTAGTTQYYADKITDLPLANFNAGTAGTVDKAYTGCVKEICNKIHTLYRLPNGKQVGYIDSLEDPEEDLPTINTNWNVGDYILVNIDLSLDSDADEARAPSTMYVIIPGQVLEYKFHSKTTDTTVVPEDLTGIELGVEVMDAEAGQEVDTTDPDVYLTYFDLTETIRGQVGIDYFVVCLTDGETIERYYFVVSDADPFQYSEPLWITGQVPYAQIDVIGGFLNVEDTDTDSGYVYRDDTGHLVLLDYSLLRSGTLAYQLGEDVTITSGIAISEVQGYLDDYVNERVAFPNAEQIATQTEPNIITVTIPLSSSESDEEEVEVEDDSEGNETTINIYNIDSRFNTSVYLKFTGSEDTNVTVNIADCEKIRIDPNIGGSPTINLYRTCLYYDSSVIDYINEIEDMSLWYERYEDDQPNLLVDSMTVRECDAAIIPEEIDYWSFKVVNDNHYMFALHSLTFAPDGSICGAGIYVRNETSNNISEGDSVIVSNFELPQGLGLSYPPTRLTHQIKITGTFVNAYATNDPEGYMVIDTNFSALTNSYDRDANTSNMTGVVAFHASAKLIDQVIGVDLGTAIDAWESNAFHIFHGETLT